MLIASVSTSAQNIPIKDVPVAVRASFAKKYPGRPCTWEKEGKNYEAGFKEHDHHLSVLWHADGTLIETEKDIPASELPGPVRSALDKRFAGKAITEAAIIITAAGKVRYEAEVEGKDELFSRQGKFLKESKD